MSLTRTTAVTTPLELTAARRTARRGWTAAIYVLLGALALFTVYPFLWMLAASFETNTQIFANTIFPFPTQPIVSNYVQLLSGVLIPFGLQYLNSVIVAVSSTLLSLAVACLAAFAFAKYRFAGNQILFGIVLFTLMMPAQISLVPMFLEMKALGLLNTLAAVILPSAVNGFGVFFLRQVMVGVPDEILAAARIDGAGDLGLLVRIVLPLVQNGLAVLAILTFLGSWNNFLWPVIVLQSNNLMTLPVGLADLVGLYKVQYGQIMAGSVLASAPIIALFVVLKDQFIAGLASGAVKG